jgi:hypothetical protein
MAPAQVGLPFKTNQSIMAKKIQSKLDAYAEQLVFPNTTNRSPTLDLPRPPFRRFARFRADLRGLYPGGGHGD